MFDVKKYESTQLLTIKDMYSNIVNLCTQLWNIYSLVLNPDVTGTLWDTFRGLIKQL